MLKVIITGREQDMKRIILVLTAFILSTNLVFAVDISKLYNLKASDIQKVKKSTLSFINPKYKDLILGSDFFIVQQKEQNTYHVIIIKKKDNKDYFYYMANTENDSLQKALLKNLKANDIKYSQVFDSKLKSFFYGEAYTDLAHSNVNINMITRPSKQPEPPVQNITEAPVNYDFSDEAQAKFNQASGIVELPKPDRIVRLPEITSNTQKTSPKTLNGGVIYINDGTKFTATLLSDISSDSLANNDRITAELSEDWVFNNMLIAPEGSILSGYAIETKPASFAMGNGQIGLLFDELMTPDGNIIPLKTNKVFIVGNEPRALNITKRIAGGAAIGLAISALTMIAGADPVDALIMGTSIGAAGGAIRVLTSKGEEVRLLEGSLLEILLTEPLSVQPYMKGSQWL